MAVNILNKNISLAKLRWWRCLFHAYRDKDLGSNDNLTVKIFSALQCNHSALADPQDMWQYDFMIYH